MKWLVAMLGLVISATSMALTITPADAVKDTTGMVDGICAVSCPRISVSSDPKATYEVLQLRKVGAHHAELTTRRKGQSGVSYAKRLYDCKRGYFKYLGSGDTLEEMKKAKPDARMTGVEDGSIASETGGYACQQLGLLADPLRPGR